MHYEEFCGALQEELFRRLDRGFAIHREQILKNNGVILDSLTLLRADTRCSPVISLDMLYERFEAGSSLSELCDYIKSIADTHLPSSVSRIRSMKCMDDLKDRITFRIISQEKNEPFLREVPWIALLDLAIIFSLSLESDGETQISTVITHTISDVWNAAPEDLLAIAKENTPRIYPPVFHRIGPAPGNFLHEISQQDVPVPALHVFTNERAHYGAACILYPDALKNLADQAGSDLLILPSSIHEVLILFDSERFSETDYGIFVSTIRHVNEHVVQPEDFLSDHLYRYSRSSGCLKLCPDLP